MTWNKTFTRRIPGLLAFAAALLLWSRACPGASPPVTAGKNQAQWVLAASYGRLPLSFEANMGQAPQGVQFLAHGPRYRLYLQGPEAAITLASPTRSQHDDLSSPPSYLRMRLVGTGSSIHAVGEAPLPGKVNYFCGGDSTRWHTGIATYGKVHYKSVYPGIDLVYYGNQQQLEYDFNLAAHADPSRIALSFAGARNLHVDRTGDLVVGISGGDLRWHAPVAYQIIDGKRKAVCARYVLEEPGKRQAGKGKSRGGSQEIGNRRVGFALAGYDASKPLVIDPTLVYSTYLGGLSSEAGNSIAVDGAGNAYVVGETQSVASPMTGTGGFPVTPGAFQPASGARNGNFGGFGTNAFVTKLNATGTAPVYSTYLGGTGPDIAYGVAVDSAGNAYVTGSTQSVPDKNGMGGFPVTPNAYQKTAGGIFITRLSLDGSTLVYSTYMGNSTFGGSDIGYGIAADAAGNAYVTGVTYSTNFPTLAQAIQPSYAGSGDAFVVKINTNGGGIGSLVYSTYLGGGASDTGIAIAIDAAGFVYVAGTTTATPSTSPAFPTTPGAFQTMSANVNNDGSADCFVAKLDLRQNGPNALIYSTLLGGRGNDNATAIAVDSAGAVYVTGFAGYPNFPTTVGAFDRTFGAGQSGQVAFSAKIDPTQSGAAGLVYSTYLGNANVLPTTNVNESGNGIAVDAAGNAYIAGVTGSNVFPVTVNAYQRTLAGGTDAFVVELNAAGSAELFGTYLGGSSQDGADGIALDATGALYVVGTTSSAGSVGFGSSGTVAFPTTPNAYQTLLGGTSQFSGSSDAFISKLQIQPPADFNQDGLSDLVLQNLSTGQIAFWFLNGASVIGGQFSSQTLPPNWQVAGVADFNGDGYPDLLLQNLVTGKIVIWYYAGSQYIGGALINMTLPANFQVVAVADFNKDGQPDLLLENTKTGQMAVWILNGTSVVTGQFISLNLFPGWQVAAVADVNQDGYPDIIIQNLTTGQIAVWYLFNYGVVLGEYVNVNEAPYVIEAVLQNNVTGEPDLVLENLATRQMAIWYLSRNIVTSGQFINMNLPPLYNIAGPK